MLTTVSQMDTNTAKALLKNAYDIKLFMFSTTEESIAIQVTKKQAIEMIERGVQFDVDFFKHEPNEEEGYEGATFHNFNFWAECH